MRYEEPSSMVRWDSPLITIPWSDEDIPKEQIWLAVTEGAVKTPNAGTTAVSISVNSPYSTANPTTDVIPFEIFYQ